MPRPRPPGHRPFGRRPFAPVALTAVLGISLLIGVGVTARPPEPTPVKVSVTRPATPSVAAPKPTPPAPVSRTVALRWSVLRTLGACALAGLVLGLAGVPVG